MVKLRSTVLSILCVAGTASADEAKQTRNFAGSVQLDYLAVPTRRNAGQLVFAGPTVELSLKLAMDFSPSVSASVKLCIACHGVETGMAFFDLRVTDQLNFRVGRMTPGFGSFPLRHDPANHHTSDKPLPYDMGRMVRFRDWNEGVLPAPWVDNGIEINGSHFFARGQIDYAVAALAGPKGNSVDFDYTLSRSGERYYVDNNTEPSFSGRLGATFELGTSALLSIGASGMVGHYDPAAKLGFAIAGADLVLQLERWMFRAEYLARWTELEIGSDPAARFKYGPGPHGYDNFFLKEGFYAEAELPLGPIDMVARWDGLRRRGNVLATSSLRSDSAVLRYTLALAIPIWKPVQLKLSVERYDFNDVDDELALHVGVAGPF